MHPSRFPRVFALFASCSLALAASKSVLARTQIPSAAQPQLATSADGRVWLVYGQSSAAPAAQAPAGEHKTGGGHGDGHAHGTGARPARPDGEIFLACSNDGGATFGPAMKVASVPNLMLGMRRGPRVAAGGDTITVTVIGSELLAFYSRDAGRSWSGPVTVNDAAGTAREGLHDLAAASDGKLFATWLDMRAGKMALWGAESTNGGKTWSNNIEVYRSPDKSICECCHPSALFDAEGNLAVMWRNSIEGTRDLWMATRARGAKEFSPARKLGTGTWKLNACPMDGGRIVAMGSGKFGSVWQRAGEVFFTPHDGAEILLGKGKQPVAVARGSEIFVFWQDGADLVSIQKAGDKPAKQATDARFASVAALPGGKGVILAYEQGPAKEKQPGIVIERL